MIEIMDTTLRDGEQTSGVSFSTSEKMSIAHLLLVDLGVNRIEVASARVSDGEFETVSRIAKWAQAVGRIDQVEILGFVDNGASAKWIKDAGCNVMNLLTKGSYKHVTEQLRKTPEQHLSDILREIEIADKMDVSINVYLEDWSNGIINSEDYVYFMMEGLKDTPINRFMLPDTLGILNPHTTWRACRRMISKFPDKHFDFHAHNDYNLAVANTMVATEVGVKGVHVTMNGLGERAGNTSLASIIAVFHDQLKLKTSIHEDKINRVSRVVETYSGLTVAANEPIVGSNVFTQTAGIHADGDSKNGLYFNELFPERFGRVREYALGKLSGKSNILKNIEELGIELSHDEMIQVTNKVIELGDKKEIITQVDLPYIISDVLAHRRKEQNIKILSYAFNLTKGLRPSCTVSIEINGEYYERTAPGDGQYHAFSKALYKMYNSLGKPIPELNNYTVYIPPGGRTDALVQTTITWKFNGNNFKTRGLDADQMVAAMIATERMLNVIENM